MRNVGRGAIDSIIAGRLVHGVKKPYETLYDFAERVDLRVCNKRVFEALIYSGALDGLNGHRAQFAAATDGAMQAASLAQVELATGQGSLFGDAGPAAATPSAQLRPTLPNLQPLSEHERLTKEKEILGFYISGHPLEPFRAECELLATHSVSQLGPWTEQQMQLTVVVTTIRKQISKKSGNEFARLTIEDFSGSAEVLVFPEAWAAIGDPGAAGAVPVGERHAGVDGTLVVLDELARVDAERNREVDHALVMAMRILDVAGGTGDIAFRMMRAMGGATACRAAGGTITVADINAAMLAVGAQRASQNGLGDALTFVTANAEQLPFDNGTSDAYTIAFGIRNVTHIERALREDHRVLRPGSRFLCLEFSRPMLPLVGPLYDRFSFSVIPWLGEHVAHDRASYQYLVERIRRFPDQDRFARLIEAAGFMRVTVRNMAGGIVALHSGWRL